MWLQIHIFYHKTVFLEQRDCAFYVQHVIFRAELLGEGILFLHTVSAKLG